MKKLFYILSLFIIILSLSSCNNKKYDIVSTNFAGFDFARAIAKDNMSTGLLLKPGIDLHDYEPSVADIECILNSKIFIYIGGESDEWVENKILPEINKNKTIVINMLDIIEEKGNIYNEENPESSIVIDIEDEYDEHVWNSISNAKVLVEEICDVIISKDLDNNDKYITNRDIYLEKLNELDINIKNVINNSNKDLLIFADRFPLLYFVKEYNLKYDAAFKGCETAKEANSKTIEKLTKKIEDNNIKVIFVIELSEATIAKTIKDNCKNDGYDVNIKTFYTMHNISKQDFKNNLTYIDLMNLNIISLEEALN